MLPDLNSQFLVQIIGTKGAIRSKNLESKLTELGLTFKISPGVILNENDFQAGFLHSAFLSNLLCQRNVSMGEVGCAVAHRNAINNFLKSNQRFGIIFEDDAEIIADFNFDMIMELLDANLPIVIVLGWIPGFAVAKNPQVFMYEEPIELATSPTCAFAYAINRSAAKLMINHHKKIIDLTDWPIYTLNKIKFYSVRSHSPWVTANHDSKFSLIGKRSISSSKSPIGVLVSRIRIVTSLITLIILSTANKLDASPKQIVHRLLIRDFLYNYGATQINEKLNGNIVVFLPLKLRKLLTLLNLN